MPEWTHETFAAMFSREALRPFQPKPGSVGLTPMLEVHTAAAVVVFVLALDGFNDWEKRREYLATLGVKCALDYGEVTAVRFGSEAWTREFTPEEEAAKGNRLVETYNDKTEAIIVMGQLADGYTLMVTAKLHPRDTGKIAYLGPWHMEQYARLRSPLLEAFWDGYRQARAREHDDA
jgi:hypothetical protein